MRRFFKSAWFPLLIVVVLAFFAHQLISPGGQEETPRYDEFIAQVEDDPESIEQVTIKTKDHTVDVKEADGGEYSTGYPENTEETLVNSLQRQDVPTQVEGTGGSSILSLLTYILPFILFFAFWVFLMNQMQGGGSKVMSFGKSRAKRMSVDAPEDHLPRRRGRRRGGAGAARDQGVPREPEEVPGARRPDPQGRAALRAARHRQDAARPRRRR